MSSHTSQPSSSSASTKVRGSGGRNSSARTPAPWTTRTGPRVGSCRPCTCTRVSGRPSSAVSGTTSVRWSERVVGRVGVVTVMSCLPPDGDRRLGEPGADRRSGSTHGSPSAPPVGTCHAWRPWARRPGAGPGRRRAHVHPQEALVVLDRLGAEHLVEVDADAAREVQVAAHEQGAGGPAGQPGQRQPGPELAQSGHPVGRGSGAAAQTSTSADRGGPARARRRRPARGRPRGGRSRRAPDREGGERRTSGWRNAARADQLGVRSSQVRASEVPAGRGRLVTSTYARADWRTVISTTNCGCAAAAGRRRARRSAATARGWGRSPGG